MKNIFAIISKEFKSYFNTPLLYVATCGFLLISGSFFFSILQEYNNILAKSVLIYETNPNLNEWVIEPYFRSLQVLLIFMIPLLTMKSFAEERAIESIEILFTSPLRSDELVLGKFFSSIILVTLMIAMSFVFPLTLIIFSDPEIAPILTGFIAILLLAWGFTAIGIFISSVNTSLTITAIVSVIVLLIFYIMDSPAEAIGGHTKDILNFLSPSNHTKLFFKGVVTGADVLYFLSIILLGISFTNRVIEAEFWR